MVAKYKYNHLVVQILLKNISGLALKDNYDGLCSSY